MPNLYSTFDPIQFELARHFSREDAADSRADAIDTRADAIATNPTCEQFEDAFCAVTRAEIEKLRAAWLNGKQAFYAAVEAHMNKGFTELAELDIERTDEALACDAREVLHDWD